MKAIVQIVVVTLMQSVAGNLWAADAGSEVLGLWNGGSSLLSITRSEGGGLSARVVALKDAVYVEGEPNGPVGAPRLDDMNPDPKLQNRPLLGMDLLSEYGFDGKKWEGQIYDPESGKTYSSNMRVGKDGVLKMRGYIGVPMFGRTAEFRSAALCDEGTVALLRAGQLPGCD